MGNKTGYLPRISVLFQGFITIIVIVCFLMNLRTGFAITVNSAVAVLAVGIFGAAIAAYNKSWVFVTTNLLISFAIFFSCSWI